MGSATAIRDKGAITSPTNNSHPESVQTLAHRGILIHHNGQQQQRRFRRSHPGTLRVASVASLAMTSGAFHPSEKRVDRRQNH
jgi:hypothetical protein